MSRSWTRRSPRKYIRPVHAVRRQAAQRPVKCEICTRPLLRKHHATKLYTVLCYECFVKEHMTQTTMTERTAYCTTCPSLEEVTGVLAPFGFSLVFQMHADDDRAYLHLAPLPAQYHFHDAFGTEVIYLAGVDQEDAPSAPRHASRFWLYAGANGIAYARTAQLLTTQWALAWSATDAPPCEAVA